MRLTALGCDLMTGLLRFQRGVRDLIIHRVVRRSRGNWRRLEIDIGLTTRRAEYGRDRGAARGGGFQEESFKDVAWSIELSQVSDFKVISQV